MDAALQDWHAEAGKVSAADLECGMSDEQMQALKHIFADAGDRGLDKAGFVAAMQRVLLTEGQRERVVRDANDPHDDAAPKHAVVNGKDMETLFLRIDVGACGSVFWSDVVSFVLLRQTRANTVKEDVGGFGAEMVRFKAASAKAQHIQPIKKVLAHRRVPRYFTASEDGMVKAWNASTFGFEQNVHNTSAWITDMLLRSPGDGSPLLSELLVVSSIDRVLSVYDADSLELVRAFRGVAKRSNRREYITRFVDNPPPHEGAPTLFDDHSGSAYMAHFRRKVCIEVTQLQGLSRVPTAMANYCKSGSEYEALVVGTDDGALMVYDIASELVGATANRYNFVPCQSFTEGSGYGWRPGHDGPVTALKAAGSIETVVSGGLDGGIKLTSLDHGRVLRTLGGRDGHGEECGHKKAVSSIAWSDERKAIASCGADRDVFLWNPFIAKPVSRLVGSRASLLDVAFNDVESQLISLSADSTVRVWDLRTLKCLQTVKEPELSAVGVDRKRRRLLLGSSRLAFRTSHAVGSVDGFRDGDAGRPRQAAKHPHAAAVTSVIVSPAARQMVSADDDHVVVWSLDTAQVTATWAVPVGITSIAFDRGHSRLLVGTATGDVMVWNPVNATLVSSFTSHKRMDEGRARLPSDGGDSHHHGVHRRRMMSKKVAPSGCEVAPILYLLSEKANVAAVAGVVGSKKVVLFDDRTTRGSAKGFLREMDMRDYNGVYSLARMHPDVLLLGTGVGLMWLSIEQLVEQPELLPSLPPAATAPERLLHGFFEGALVPLPAAYLTRGKLHGRDEWSAVDAYIEQIVVLSRCGGLAVVSRGDGTVAFYSCPTETHEGRGELFRFLAAPVYGTPVHCLATNTAQTLLYTGDACGYLGVYDISRVGRTLDRHGFPAVDAAQVVKLKGFRAGHDGVTSVTYLEMPRQDTAAALRADTEPAPPPGGGGFGAGSPPSSAPATPASTGSPHEFSPLYSADTEPMEFPADTSGEEASAAAAASGGVLFVSTARDIVGYHPDGRFRFRFGVPDPLRPPPAAEDAAAWAQTMAAHRRQVALNILLGRGATTAASTAALSAVPKTMTHVALAKEASKHPVFAGMAAADLEEFLAGMAVPYEPTQVPAGRRASHAAAPAKAPARYVNKEETDVGWSFSVHADLLRYLQEENHPSGSSAGGAGTFRRGKKASRAARLHDAGSEADGSEPASARTSPKGSIMGSAAGSAYASAAAEAADRAARRPPRAATARVHSAHTRAVHNLIAEGGHQRVQGAWDFDTRTPRSARPPSSRGGIVKTDHQYDMLAVLRARPHTANAVGAVLPECVRQPPPEVTALQRQLFEPPAPAEPPQAAAAAPGKSKRDRKADRQKERERAAKEPAPPKEKAKYVYPADVTHGPQRLAKAPFKQFYTRPGTGTTEGHHGAASTSSSTPQKRFARPGPSRSPSPPQPFWDASPGLSPAQGLSPVPPPYTNGDALCLGPGEAEDDLWDTRSGAIGGGAAYRSPVRAAAEGPEGNTVYWRSCPEDVARADRQQQGGLRRGSRAGGGATRRPAPRLVLQDDRHRSAKAARFEVVGTISEDDDRAQLGRSPHPGLQSASPTTDPATATSAASPRAVLELDGDVSDVATVTGLSGVKSRLAEDGAAAVMASPLLSARGAAAQLEAEQDNDAELAAQAAAAKEWFVLAQKEFPPSKRRKQKFDVGSMPLRALTHLDLSTAPLKAVKDVRRVIPRYRAVGVQGPSDDLVRLHNIGL
eukprot:TRINITY_DN22520_c0_g1_i1.p1 TRINITY_DN22520_c0_g1~~TRINITY_DN22520_c0_g1_i1.p1  ORF type:complete len:1735 (+),score=612.75 TRINITY_DN22520_c0_g1_i1:166-5370(+)